MRTTRLLTVSRPPPDADSKVMWPVMHAGKQTLSRPYWTACKNMTLSQTSFGGGNDMEVHVAVEFTDVGLQLPRQLFLEINGVLECTSNL